MKGASPFNSIQIQFALHEWFSTLKKLFFRENVFLRKLVLLKKTIYYIYIFKNLFFEQLNRSFNSPILCQLKISLFKLLSFSFPPSPPFFSKFERTYFNLSSSTGDDPELSWTVYAHTRRVIFPLPSAFYNRQQLETAVGSRNKDRASRLRHFSLDPCCLRIRIRKKLAYSLVNLEWQ